MKEEGRRKKEEGRRKKEEGELVAGSNPPQIVDRNRVSLP
jgi:hypothetical protein